MKTRTNFSALLLLASAWLLVGTLRGAPAGGVVVWGDYQSGQTAVPTNALSGVTAIAAGAYHTVAVKTNGSVIAWGYNYFNQATVPAAALSGVTAASAGYAHTLALKNNGAVLAWGNDSYGQITVPVAAQSGVTAIAAGYYHSVALKNDGSVLAWGYNGSSQTDVPVAAQSGVIGIAAGYYHTVALKSDGSVVAWGYNGQGQTNVPNAAKSDVMAITAGGFHTVALKSDGSVIVWGNNGSGQTNVPPAAQSGVIAISGGAHHTIALKSDGSVVGWGYNEFGQVDPPPNAQTGAIAVAAGYGHSVALVIPTLPIIVSAPASRTVRSGQPASMSVRATGFPLSYQWRKDGVDIPGATGSTCSLGAAETNHVGAYTVVVTSSVGSVTSAPPAFLTVEAPIPGAVQAWGDNTYGQRIIPVTALSGVVALAAGGSHTVTVKTNGAVLAWGSNEYGQTTVPAAAQSGVKAIAGGGFHTVALKSNGTVVAWGLNSDGQVTIPPGAQSGVMGIAAGRSHTVAVRTDGSVVAWGNNVYGQTSVPLAGQSGVVAVAAGDTHTLALKRDGSVVAWGSNLQGQGNASAAQSDVIAIAAGQYHSVALKSDGSVMAWGYNNNGQTTVPESAKSGVTAIAAGLIHTLALKTNGTVQAWGGEHYHEQTVVPGFLMGAIGVAAGEYHSAALVLPTTPAIITQPQSQSVSVGQNASFGVFASGYPLYYQWRFNGTNIIGATQSFLSLANVSSNHAGAYTIVVTNGLGSVTSLVATLTVIYSAPTATIYQSGGYNPSVAGVGVALCANVSGAPLPTLQWQHNGTNLPGKTDICLYLTGATNESGNYTMVVSNSINVSTSAVYTLSIIERPPVYAFSYYQMPIPAGYGLYLCSEVILPTEYTLQWRFNGAALPAATGPCLYIPSVTPDQAGAYTVEAITSSGSYTSPPVNVSIYYAPLNFSQFYFTQGSADALLGNDITVCGYFGGSLPSYQWRFNGVDLPGQTNSCLTLLAITTNQAGAYTLVASNQVSVVTSIVQNITVRSQAPVFSYQPSNVSAVEGTDLRFTILAAAGPPAQHVLQLNGTNTGVPFNYETHYDQFGFDGVDGGFTLLDVTPADGGSYRVIASNTLGVVTSAVFTLTVTPAGPLDRWTQRNPLPQSQFIYSVCHGTNLFVAVGDRGTIMTSPDGTNWTVQSRRVDLPLNGVTYGGGLFVAVGDGGTVLTSPDGTNWSYRFSNPLTSLQSVAYGNGRFVTLEDMKPFALTSTDGVEWQKVAVPDYQAGRSLAFGNGIFVAAGDGAIMFSTNGLDWTVAVASNVQYESVAFVNNQFITVGNTGVLLVSSDGQNWVARPSGTTRRLLGVTYGQGRFVAVGVRGTLLTSPDAITWSVGNSGTPDRLETIDFLKGTFVALGENGTTISSTTGTTWTKQNFGITRDLDGMAVGDGTVVIVGKGGTILTSTDGTNYIARSSGYTNDLHGVGWGNGMWVAVGEPGFILTSTNTIDWTLRPTGNTNSLKAATWANGKWMVVGTQGTLLTSSNGVTWAEQILNFYLDLNDVAYGNGVYLIVGDGLFGANGSMFTSPDGFNWTQRSPLGKNLRGVTYADDQFLVAANDGQMLLLLNPAAGFVNFWLPAGNLRASTLAPGVWAVVGNRGAILTTTNVNVTANLSWVKRASRTIENLHEIVYFRGKFIAIGNRGTILQSGRFETELGQPSFVGPDFQLPFKGVINQAYQVQATTDFVNWTNLTTITNLAEDGLYIDPGALQQGRRFYRLKKP